MITSSYQPAPGRFLISEPFMEDEHFQRSVVLLVEHGSNGSFGFVINMELQTVLSDVIEGISDRSPLLLGGPVQQDSLHYIHRLGNKIPDSRHVYGDLYWGGDFDTIKSLLHTSQIGQQNILFIAGYSGWSTGQLSRELERKSWIVAPESVDQVFAKDRKNLWKMILRGMGSKFQVISNYPTDPRLN